MLLALAALAYVFYLVRNIWLPLAIAFLIAMVLDPVVDRMEKRGLSRLMATILIFAAFFTVVGAVLYLSVPAVIRQGQTLSAEFDRFLPDRSPKGIDRYLQENNVWPPARAILTKSAESMQYSLNRSFSWFSEHGIELVSNLIWLVIIPIVAFYALKDFHLILAKTLLLVPKEKRDSVRSTVSEVTAVFAKYIRGLALVSFLNGLTTWLVLLAFGMPGSLVVGLIAGLIYSVPYFGALVTVAMVAAISFLSGGFEYMVLVTGANIILHQIIFDNMVVPKVLGGHVGLHPIWAILALLIGNGLLGLVGMILAVPVAACIQMAVVALQPRLSYEIDLKAKEKDAAAQLTEQTKEEHLKISATEVLHQAVSEAVEDIEAQAENGETSTA